MAYQKIDDSHLWQHLGSKAILLLDALWIACPSKLFSSTKAMCKRLIWIFDVEFLRMQGYNHTPQDASNPFFTDKGRTASHLCLGLK